jgi:hypothetical protein
MNDIELNEAKRHFILKRAIFSLKPTLHPFWTSFEQKSADTLAELDNILQKENQEEIRQGILKGEVSLYHWPPVWLVWISLFCK